MRSTAFLTYTARLTIGALFVATLAVSGNLLPPIGLVAGVPLTLQNFFVAMLGLTLGIRSGLTALTATLLLALCGLPIFAGGQGGPGVFVGPTCGYIYGWYLLVLLMGWYRAHLMPHFMDTRRRFTRHLPLCFGFGMIGIVIDYFLGTVGLLWTTNQPLKALGTLWLSHVVFLPADALKIAAAALVSAFLLSHPGFRRSA